MASSGHGGCTGWSVRISGLGERDGVWGHRAGTGHDSSLLSAVFVLEGRGGRGSTLSCDMFLV